MATELTNRKVTKGFGMQFGQAVNQNEVLGFRIVPTEGRAFFALLTTFSCRSESNDNFKLFDLTIRSDRDLKSKPSAIQLLYGR